MCRSCWWYLSLDFSCHHEEGDGQLQFEGHWLVADGQHVSSKVIISSWRIDLQNYVSWSHRIAGVNEKTKANEWLNRKIVNIPDATWIYNDHQRYTRIILRIYISHISPYILQWISRRQEGSQHSRHLLGSQPGAHGGDSPWNSPWIPGGTNGIQWIPQDFYGVKNAVNWWNFWWILRLLYSGGIYIYMSTSVFGTLQVRIRSLEERFLVTFCWQTRHEIGPCTFRVGHILHWSG